MRITLVHNPKAGYGGMKQEQLLSLLRRAGYEPRDVSSKDDQIDRALEDPGEMVVVAGGDGTVARIAVKLAGREIPVAILPAGTANNIALSLGIRGSFESLIKSWSNAKPRKVDLGTARGRWGEQRFIESFGLGLLAQMMRNIEPMHNASRQKFQTRQEEFRHALRDMKKVIERTGSHEYAIEIDGVDRSGAYVLVEAMNIACIGPNLCVAPQADVSDGMLDLVLLPADQCDPFREYLARQIEGEHNPPELTTVRGKKMVIDPKGAPLHIDDELHSESHDPLEPPGAIELTVNAGQVTFLLS